MVYNFNKSLYNHKRIFSKQKKLKKLTTKKYNENDVSLKDVLDICKQRYEKYQFRLNNLKYELKSINKEFKFHEYNPKNITLTFSKNNKT